MSHILNDKVKMANDIIAIIFWIIYCYHYDPYLFKMDSLTREMASSLNRGFVFRLNRKKNFFLGDFKKKKRGQKEIAKKL